MARCSVFTVALAALTLVAFCRSASACASAPPPGWEGHIEHEDALIVWDEAAHTEHFIRTARFAGSAHSFGFLIPTPTRPVLAEAGEGLAAALKTLSAPAVVHRTRYDVAPIGCTALPLRYIIAHSGPTYEPTTSDAPPVRVLEEEHVAGLDAVVLEADDAGALGAWLEAHHFEFRSALRRWIAPYIAYHWKITAFRYTSAEDTDAAPPAPPAPSKPCACIPGDPLCACDAAESSTGAEQVQLSSRMIRLSFSSPAPVFPYREPDDASPVPSRELRLFVIAKSSVAGRLSGAITERWPAVLNFASQVKLTPELSAALPGLSLPAEFWLSDFDDRTVLRPTADLVFAVDDKPRKVLPSRIIVFDDWSLPIPYELPFVVGAFIWWRRRRARILAEYADS